MYSCHQELRTVLSDMVAKRLPDNNKLLRVVGWSANGGCQFRSRPGVRRYEVSYWVQLAV